MQIPAIKMKSLVLSHWLLTIWGCMFTFQILPASYAWSNFTLLAVGVWAIAQRDSMDAAMMFLIGVLLSILTDIIHFGICFPLAGKPNNLVRFSMSMTIANLLLKPFTCFFTYKVYHERGGDFSISIGTSSAGSPGLPTVTQNSGAYQSFNQHDQSTGSGS